MPDFWPACGYRHLAVTGEHRLAVTDDFLRMYLLRPELAPIAESCDNELRLHEALLAEPRAAVPAPAIDAVADADVRDNFRIWLRFRDRLLAALAACSMSGPTKLKEEEIIPPDQLYATALADMDAQRYNHAIEELQKLERQHPYSEFNEKAKLMEENISLRL